MSKKRTNAGDARRNTQGGRRNKENTSGDRRTLDSTSPPRQRRRRTAERLEGEDSGHATEGTAKEEDNKKNVTEGRVNYSGGKSERRREMK